MPLFPPPAWRFLGSGSLSQNSATLTISNLDSVKWLWIFIRISGTSAAVNSQIQFNGDTAANYSGSINGTGATAISIAPSSAGDAVSSTIIVRNIATDQKTCVMLGGVAMELAPGTKPSGRADAGGWSNITSQINSITVLAPGANLLAGTEITVYGSDG